MFQSLLSHRLFQSLGYYFQETSYKKNDYVYKEGQKSENIYIISSGTFKIMKNIEL